MIEELKKNLEQEKKLVKDVDSILKFLNSTSTQEQDFYLSTLKALIAQLKILNGSMPELLNAVSSAKSLVPEEIKFDSNLTKISYLSPITKEQNSIVINKKDSEKFIKELKISHEGIKNLKEEDFNKVSPEVKQSKIFGLANKIFVGLSDKIVSKIPELSEDLKKSNINILASTYVSLALLSSFAILIIGVIFFAFISFLNPGMIIWIWVPFLLFIISIFAFYLYPSSEKGTANSRIAQEMPFATIYMTAIAGSNVEPSKIFKILSLSKEYPYISQELKKVISQVEIYGYDLVSSLKNAAKRTASESFSELLGGIATNISSGGSLKDYLEKKTENFLADYKLERQKYNSLAELFMDIYISVLITGPLILMVLFMVMNLGKFQIGGLSMNTLLILTVGLVVFANIVFIIILDIKQPKN
jgi:flagellar protein FlaJ